jgi:hypothetical protein
MNPHKIKRKPVTAQTSQSHLPQESGSGSYPSPQRTPQPKGPLGRNENVTNVESTPPFPIMRRGDVISGSPSKAAQSPSGPRTRQSQPPLKDDAGGKDGGDPPSSSTPLPVTSTRPDGERQVARPPVSGPRAPIRDSATTGLTSVHIGTKPRVAGQDAVGQTTVRMKKSGSDPDTDMNRFGERIPAIPGKGYGMMKVHEAEDVPGVGVGYGRRMKMLSNADYDDEDKQTEFTSSSANSNLGESRDHGHGQQHYKPKFAVPTISVEEQAAKYDADYRARLRRAERGRSRGDEGVEGNKRSAATAIDDEAYWQESMLNDDPRIEGIYTFDYSPNPVGQKKKSRPKTHEEELSRITEYEDPSRPGIVMKSRKYLPPPVDERSYGVPAGRRVRAFARERERMEGGQREGNRNAIGNGKEKTPNPATRRKEVSTYSAFSASSEEKAVQALPVERRRRPLLEERESVTPKASQAPLAAERPGPAAARSNPNMRQGRVERQPQYQASKEEYEEDEARFRQKVRKLRSEPAFHREAEPRVRHETPSYAQ